MSSSVVEIIIRANDRASPVAAQAEYYMASAGGTDLATAADIMTGFQLQAGEMFRDNQGRNVNSAHTRT